jgi:branched-chain amino acid transport system substrate-binding protein
MTTLRRPTLLAILAVLLLVATACGDTRSTQGSDGDDAPPPDQASDSGDDTASDEPADGTFQVDASGCPPDTTEPLADGEPIKIGASLPLSGPLASAGLTALGMEAYFESVNRDGGIDGHDIELIARDDAYDPGRAVSNAQTFVGSDGVMANVTQVSEANIEATQPIYEEACVPQLWVITTSASFSDPTSHPWTILGIPPTPVEAQMLAEYIAAEQEGATVMELTGPDALGRDFHASFPPIAEELGLEVLEPQMIAADATSIDAQVTAIASADPDAVVGETLPNFCPMLFEGLARAGYDGLVVVNSSCNGAAQWISPVDPAGDGVVTPMFRKDPADPRYADDPAMVQYFEDMEAIGAAGDAAIGNALDGYNFGVLIAQNLADAAAMDGGLTRANLMTAAWNTTVERPLSLTPDQTTGGPDDPFLVEAGELHRYIADTSGWETTDVSVDLEGRTGELVGG